MKNIEKNISYSSLDDSSIDKTAFLKDVVDKSYFILKDYMVKLISEFLVNNNYKNNIYKKNPSMVKSITDDFGPINFIFDSSQIFTKFAFSDKKPNPG